MTEVVETNGHSGVCSVDIQECAVWTRKRENGCGMSRMRKLALRMREVDEVVA